MAESTQILEIKEDDRHGWTFVVTGDNGEVQVRGERYETEHNARRGLADLTRTILGAVGRGEIEMIE